MDDAEVGAPPVKLNVITHTGQFAAERLNSRWTKVVLPMTSFLSRNWVLCFGLGTSVGPEGNCPGLFTTNGHFLVCSYCHADCAAACFKALDGIGRAVRQHLAIVSHIDMPVLSASYSKTGAFAACKYIRGWPRYEDAGAEVEPIADQQVVIDGGHSFSGRFIQPSMRDSDSSTRANKPPSVPASVGGLFITHVTSRM